MEAEKTKLLIATQAQKVIEKGTRNSEFPFLEKLKLTINNRGRN
jgi:hypothetical protein